MQLPKLTPLQSRLLASAITTGTLIVVWILFQPRHFVYAAELPLAPEHVLDSQLGRSIPHDALDASIVQTEEEGNEEQGAGGYAPDFAYFDRGLIGRADDGVETLTNNVKKVMEANSGTTRNFVLEKSQLRARETNAESGFANPLDARSAENTSEKGANGAVDDGEEDVILEEHGEEMRKRQSGQQVWLSANTCRRPEPTTKLITGEPPQLTLYVSTSTKNRKPGPGATNDLLGGGPIAFQGGYANFSMPADSDVFIGVSVPANSPGWEGSWRYEVAASVEGYYHNYQGNDTFLGMVDTDSESALFITPNLTDVNHTQDIDKWLSMAIPFTMYAFPNDTWSPMAGLERSFCGLSEMFNRSDATVVSTKFTTGFGGNVKGQFHVQGLNASRSYGGFLAVNGTTEGLAIPGTGVVRQGGQIWKQFNWLTKADDSCQVIFDLEFCSDIAYAVPSNERFKLNSSGLATLYDNQAKTYFQNFNRSLDQVACDTTGSAQYSLARTCDDCRNDYKDWLCSVLMPRCENWNATSDFLQPRNIAAPFRDQSIAYASNMTAEFNETIRDRAAYSKSRNPMIDEVIQPGPYKELKPCEDLCFDIVRSCPAQLGFSCPNEPARSLTYGRRNANPDILTCNFPGVVVNLNAKTSGAGALVAGLLTTLLAAGAVTGVLWV